ncbi:RFX-type winged-helix domain-containing protein [Mycena venus]|uniref:RFX-type winged-helix domain-containing protein n=1 Tax=Mycena venus TaxID=2733690 RepID=A0A8H7CYG1_9AGAR|nr:RFX-type winged-helix domain-containing protein [Mycena venus]
MMALQMSNNMPLDFLPNSHSRSNSVSSSSTHSSNSRPQSSSGLRMQPGLGPSQDDLYRVSYQLGHHNGSLSDHSPPNHNLANPALKNHLAQRPTSSHIRAARTQASPYPGGSDRDSVHSSSSETDDISMFLGGHAAPDYHSMFGQPQTMAPNQQEAMHAAGAFGRMTLSPDHALEKLAANVRAATTTSASDRAKQIFVQAWLTANYAPYPDGNVPRQGLYFSYRRVCDQYGIPHINTATLGKAIRLCFPTIKTRRLGVRGNSKYHYCGIRPATSAEAEWLQDYIHKSNNNAGQAAANAGNARLASESNRSEDRSDEDEDEDSEGASSAMNSKRNSLTLGADLKGPTFSADLSDKTPTAATLSNQAAQRPPGSYPLQASIRRHPPQEGGAWGQQPTSVRQFPHFPSIEEAVGVNSTSPHGIAAREVWGWFQDHLDSLLESVRSFRFDQFEMHLRTFWSSLGGNHREVVHAPAIAGLMAKADAIVYDVRNSRNFALANVVADYADVPGKSATIGEQDGKDSAGCAGELWEHFCGSRKLNSGPGSAISSVSANHLRFLDIYQVTQALNTVLTNQKQLAEMRRSWQKVDFESVRNQSALVCNCRHEDLVQLLEVEFVGMLDSLTKSTEPVREVMTWADKCCERLMGSSRASHGGSEERSTMSSRSVLIRWGYVTSQVMRDLTIRSDPAFGAFQIMKLFLDDWIAVNVLRSVALSTNSVAASVEPVMQQQFFTVSPMAGQENFNSGPQHLMAHTPTTSSMLAALQNDPFPSGSLDPSSSAFNSDAYGSLGYMDTSPPGQDDSLSAGAVHQSSLSFGDFSGSGNGFDSFTQDLGMHTTGTPAGSEPDSNVGDPEPVKTEQQGV